MVMKKGTYWIGSFATLLLLFFSISDAFGQSQLKKCSGSILAVNVAPLGIAAESGLINRPCKEEKKRINQSPRSADTGGIEYYNDVAIDRLGETFINTFPGLTDPSYNHSKKPCASDRVAPQKLTACQKAAKKDCPTTNKAPAPQKRLRPSATVKLIKY